MNAVRVLAPNPGVRTLEGTNTWVVGDGPCLVIDPGPDDDRHLEEVLRRAGGVVAVLLTHAHDDHAAGAVALADAADAPLFAARPPDVGQRLHDGQAFEAPGVRLLAIATPGHAADHVAFHGPDAGALFTGDAILGAGTSVIDPPDGDLAAYLRSLRRMRDLAPSIIYPGHGPTVLRAVAKIDEYLAHRALREEQILSLLAEEPASVGELVEQIYVAYPVEVYPMAERTVTAHLQKLEREGRIDAVSGQTPTRYRVGRPQACEKCGRPVRGAARLCGACAVSSLQEPS